jgi:hypothetical protein
MASRDVERAAGIGSVCADDRLLRMMRYDLSISVGDAQDGEGENSSKILVDGTIDVADIGEATVLSGPRQLVLHLEDGRRVAFALTSTSGRVRGRLLPD